jgi:hypothetical protein
MKIIIFLISFLIFSINVIGQQGKLLFGTSCKCKLFAEKQNLSSEVEEIGVYEEFPELVSPKPDEVEKYLNAIIKESIDITLSLKINETGEVDCIYLSKGELIGEGVIRLSDIIETEFIFKPAIRRGKPISSIFNLKVFLE